MKLDWAILSNSAEIQNNLSYVLGGGWDTSWRLAYPSPFLGALTVRLLQHRVEAARPHKLEVHALNEDGQPFAPPVTITLAPGLIPPDFPQGWDIPTLVAIDLRGLMIPKAGRYSFEVLIDDSHAKSIPFRFILGGPPGARPEVPLKQD